MTYSDTQIQTFRDELAFLSSAYDKLIAGILPEKFIIDGDLVQYHQGSIPYLKERIGELKSILSAVDYPGTNCTAFHFTTVKGL